MMQVCGHVIWSCDMWCESCDEVVEGGVYLGEAMCTCKERGEVNVERERERV